MKYLKPVIITFTEEELAKSIIAFASCGATYCSYGTTWGSTCGSAKSYCPANASYAPYTGFCSTGNTYIICPAGATYSGPYNESTVI